MAYRDVPRLYKIMRQPSLVVASPQPNELSQTIHLLLTLSSIFHRSFIAVLYIDQT